MPNPEPNATDLRGVSLDAHAPPSAPCLDLERLSTRVRAATGDLESAVVLARDIGLALAPPGSGRTRERWSVLATLGAWTSPWRGSSNRTWTPSRSSRSPTTPTWRRLGPTTTWGVYAAEGAAGRLVAHVDPERGSRMPNGWRLRGTKPWCSLAEDVTHALVTAWVDDVAPGLFAVYLGSRECTSGSRAGCPAAWRASAANP